MAPAIAFANLGCRLNIAESDALAARFVAAGYRVVATTEPADVVVVNTCTVTGQADRKSRNALNRAARGAAQAEPAASGQRAGSERQDARPLVVATGCYVTAQGGVACDLPGVDYAVDNARKSQIFDLVTAHLAGEVVDPAALPADPFGYRPGAQPLHTRATIKIQDGCDNFCTFCIIPAVRGRALSRPAPDILDEARRLLDEATASWCSPASTSAATGGPTGPSAACWRSCSRCPATTGCASPPSNLILSTTASSS